MLRLTVELIPDGCERVKRGSLVRIIDIKEDGTGSWSHGNYKSRFYNHFYNPAHPQPKWRQKQVLNFPYKGYYHEKLILEVFKRYVEDYENDNVEATKRKPLYAYKEEESKP